MYLSGFYKICFFCKQKIQFAKNKKSNKHGFFIDDSGEKHSCEKMKNFYRNIHRGGRERMLDKCFKRAMEATE